MSLLNLKKSKIKAKQLAGHWKNIKSIISNT